MPLQTQVGQQRGANASYLSARSGILGDLIASELHGRFYEANFQGNLFSVGITATSIANATFSTATGLSGTLGTAATATPVIGLWNPSASNVNAAILQAMLAGFITASTVTGTGGLVWCVFTGNPNITVASQQVPLNCKTLAASGSQMKGLNTLALTGLSNVGTYLRASALQAGPQTNYSQVGTAVGFPNGNGVPSVENIDGSIIVPPGGILALFTTATPVAISVATGLTWEEVPLA